MKGRGKPQDGISQGTALVDLSTGDAEQVNPTEIRKSNEKSPAVNAEFHHVTPAKAESQYQAIARNTPGIIYYKKHSIQRPPDRSLISVW